MSGIRNSLKKLFLNCRFDPPFWEEEFRGLQCVWKFEVR